LFLLLPLLGFLVVTVVTSVGISCCYCCYLCWDFLLLLLLFPSSLHAVVSTDFIWSILGLFLVEYTGFIWLLGLCTQFWCIDLEAQGDQS